jgi:hypothetical protein
MRLSRFVDPVSPGFADETACSGLETTIKPYISAVDIDGLADAISREQTTSSPSRGA